MFGNQRKKIIVIVIFIGIFIYGIYQFRGIFIGPEILIVEPHDGLSTTSPVIDFVGIVLRARTVNLNDRDVFIDPKGLFKERVILMPGYNYFEVSAYDRFGKKGSKKLEVFLREPQE